MKIKTLIVSILGSLAVASVSPAQGAAAPEPELQEPVSAESSPPEQELESLLARVAELSSDSQTPRSRRYIGPATTRPAARSTMELRTTRPATQEAPSNVRIFNLKHARAVELGVLITNALQIQVHPDQRTNCLIVTGTEEQIKGVESLIVAMDVGPPEASTPQKTQDFVYRIYMFEIASEDRGLKPFSMTLLVSGDVPSQQLLNATADDGLEISEFTQGDHKVSNQVLIDGKVMKLPYSDPRISTEILIQGKAASNESLMHLVERIPKSHITELKWDDAETFTSEVAVAEFTQLPAELQKHIAKFLGFGVQTVGYWFGNLSAPGSVEAPIGPWILKLMLDTASDRMLELRVDVKLPIAVGNDILSNTIRAKIGKPIIIGYNRESYGTRKMGAMVIVPEADSL
jgi:hypothetical protein